MKIFEGTALLLLCLWGTVRLVECQSFNSLPSRTTPMLLPSPLLDLDGYDDAATRSDVYELLDGVSSLTFPSTHKMADDGSVFSTTATAATTTMTSRIKTFGRSNIPYDIPMSRDSRFPIASNSKLYTAVAIYQLAERGKLDVTADIATMLDEEDFAKFGWDDDDDDDVKEGKVERGIATGRLGGGSGSSAKKFCPHLVNDTKCQKITLQNLLSMSSGIYPQLNCDAPEPSPGQCNQSPWILPAVSIGQVVGEFLDEPLMFVPGSQYHYSNPNFVLAAYFVEKYSGMTFREYLQENIFSVLCAKNGTTYFDHFNGGYQLDPLHPTQYTKYYDKTTQATQTPELISVGSDVVQLDLGAASGTGGIVSTVESHATFWRTLFNKTSKGWPLLQSVESYEAILKPWMLMGQTSIVWNNRTFPVWEYYTQGTTVLCTAPDCPEGHKRWIVYFGQRISCNTTSSVAVGTGRRNERRRSGPCRRSGRAPTWH